MSPAAAPPARCERCGVPADRPRGGEYADKINAMPKHVVSTTLQNPSGTSRACSPATPAGEGIAILTYRPAAA